MAKPHVTIEKKKETTEENGPQGKHEEVTTTTKKEVVDNLDPHSESQKLLEEKENLKKREEKFREMEARIAKDKKETEDRIKEKEAQLRQMPVHEEKKTTTKTEVKEVKEEKKKGKIDLNPLNRGRYWGTRLLSGVGMLGARTAALANRIVGRPQALADKQFYKDLGTNIIKSPKVIFKDLIGALYKPWRGEKYVDMGKDYGGSFSDPKDKSKVMRGLKKGSFVVGKGIAPILPVGTFMLLPKATAHIGDMLNSAGVELIEGIRDSKWHWNPKNWNFKPWKFTKTKQAFKKLTSWKYKRPDADGTKIIDTTPKKEVTTTTTYEEQDKLAA